MNFRNRGIRFGPALLFTFFMAGSLAQIAADPVPSVVLIRSAPNPVVEGQKTTLIAGVNATVTEWPSGTVTLRDTCSNGGAPITSVLGSFTLGSATSATPGNGSMVVSSFPCLGANHIAAFYSGDSNYSAGTSQPLIETVLSKFAPTGATLTSSANPVTTGQEVTFTAKLSYTFVENSHATGKVIFADTSTGKVLGTGTVETAGSGKQQSTYASITTSPLAPGRYAVEAKYSGDNIYGSSTSQILNEVVQEATTDPTTTELTASASKINIGAAVKLTALVKSTLGIPAGAVSFYDGKTLLATLNLGPTGRAALTTSSLGLGAHSITADYGGDVTFAKSASAAVKITVQRPTLAVTTTVLKSSSNPAPAGTPIALVATVTSKSSGTPTGTVTFQNDSAKPAVVLGTGTLKNGLASLNRAFAAGTYKLAAVYSGDLDFSGSTGTLSEVVNPPTHSPTKTAITSSANPSTHGQAVTFTATVTGSKATPTGDVTFNVGGNSAVVKLDSNGKAVFTTSALPAGSLHVSAVYGGDAINAGSTSPILGQTIERAETTVSIRSSLSPSTVGTSITFTAAIRVNAPGSGTPAGTFSFADGSTVLCSNVKVQTNAAASCLTTALAAGSHTVTATYSGDANFLSSSKSVAQTVLGYVRVDQLSMSGSGFVYNRANRLFMAKAAVTNVGNSAVAGPIQAVFTQMAAGVTVVNANGTFQGAPYITLAAPLEAGQSASFEIEISDPLLLKLTGVVQFYSGQFQ